MPRPASDMTTDEIAADIRQRIAANPVQAAALQDVAERLAANLRDRLPYIDDADLGAVLVTLSAWTTHALQLFAEYGMDPATTGQTVANVIAIAGTQLYGQTTTEATR